MPSHARIVWRDDRCLALDELEAAHRAVGGAGPGRRSATQQINQSYAVMLSSQFQGFCRDLHSEATDFLAQHSTPVAYRVALRSILTTGRKLDKGNPNPRNIGADFNKFGLVFWDELRARDGRTADRHDRLVLLNAWRNAIAHQDFTAPALSGRTVLRLADCRSWRATCNALSVTMDVVLRDHLRSLVGAAPWQ